MRLYSAEQEFAHEWVSRYVPRLAPYSPRGGRGGRPARLAAGMRWTRHRLAIGLMGATGGGAGLRADRGARHIEIRYLMIHSTRLPLAYSAVHYAAATAVALAAASLVAGCFPARKASRGHPVDIIRGAT